MVPSSSYHPLNCQPEALPFPEAGGDHSTEDDSVRFTAAFATGLDPAALGCARATPAAGSVAVGRPSHG